MQLLRPSDIQGRRRLPNDIVCKACSIRAFLAIVVMAAFFCGFPALFIYRGRDIPVTLMIFSGLMGAVFVGVFLCMFLKTLKPGNWLLKYSDGEFLIKFRSYLNDRLPGNDVQIIRLSRDEVASVNKTKIKRITWGTRNGKQTEYLTFIDIHLNTTQTCDIAQALAEERKKRIKTKHGSHITGDYPVVLFGSDTIRICWKGITPFAGKLLGLLSGVSVTETVKITEDMTLSRSDKDKIDDQIIRLLETGSKIAAIRLVQKRQGISLKDAKDFVESLEN